MPSTLLLASAFCLLQAAPGGEELVEPATGVRFPAMRTFLDLGREPLTAVGTAVRSREGFRFYTLCLYVDLKALRAKAKGHPSDPETLGRLLIHGGISHGFVTNFYAGVAGERRMAFLQENLRRTWPEFNPEDPKARDFLDFFREDLKRGDTTEVWIDAKGALYGRRAGKAAARAESPKLARAFSATYFGDQPMDAGFKKELLEGLARALGKPASPSRMEPRP